MWHQRTEVMKCGSLVLKITFMFLKFIKNFKIFNLHLTLIIHLKAWSATWKISYLFYMQFLFVRYSVNIIFRVIFYVLPEKKLGVVRATQVVYTIVYIVYNLLSASCIVIPTVCIRLCKYTRDITKNTQTQLDKNYISHNLV